MPTVSQDLPLETELNINGFWRMWSMNVSKPIKKRRIFIQARRSYRQSNRRAFYPDIEASLYEELMEGRKIGACISRAYIQASARKIAQERNIFRFVSTNCWLVNFLKRHRLSLRRIKSTRRALPADSIDIVKEHLQKMYHKI